MPIAIIMAPTRPTRCQLRIATAIRNPRSKPNNLPLQYYKEWDIPVVILRPGFVYGPRDKTVMPRIIDALRHNRLRYPGGGEAAMNLIFVNNLVDAVFLAVENEKAVGEVYNLTDGEFVSKRKFIGAIADAMDLPHPTRTPPLWFAWTGDLVGREAGEAARGRKSAPLFNFPRLKFIGYNLDFSIQKAMDELGYRPRSISRRRSARRWIGTRKSRLPNSCRCD